MLLENQHLSDQHLSDISSFNYLQPPQVHPPAASSAFDNMSREPPMPPEKKHASCRLSKNQEKKVLEYCSQYLDCGHISLKGCAGRIGNALYHKPKKQTKEGYLAGPLNKNWGSNFCSRYPELKVAIDKGKKSARLSVKASAADFKARLVKCIEKYNIQPDDMYAVKEWGFITTKYADRQKMTLHRPSNPDHEPRNLASAILCISRKGRFLTPYLITKGKKSADFEKKSRVWLGSNPNGWADEFDFAKWYQYFETKTRGHSNRKTRPWRLLLVEGHRSPITEQCFVRALKKRIIIFSYPRHKAGQLDPFCCGVLDYLERRFVEWLTPRWEERSTRGEEIVEIESLDLAATVSWFTVAGKDDSSLTVEREFEIRTAWVKCVQNWTRGGDSGVSKELKSTMVKLEQVDKESNEDHAETESENEGPSDQPSIQNKMETAGSVRTQTTKSGPSKTNPVEVICLDSDLDLPNNSTGPTNCGHKRTWSKAIGRNSELQLTHIAGAQSKKHQPTNQSQVTSLPPAQLQPRTPSQLQAASAPQALSEPQAPSQPNVPSQQRVSPRPQTASRRRGASRPPTSSRPQGRSQSKPPSRPRALSPQDTVFRRQVACQSQAASELQSPSEPHIRSERQASPRSRAVSQPRGPSEPQAPLRPRTPFQAQASSQSHGSHRQQVPAQRQPVSGQQTPHPQRTAPPPDAPSEPRVFAHESDSYRPHNTYYDPPPSNGNSNQGGPFRGDSWRPNKRRRGKNRRSDNSFERREDYPGPLSRPMTSAALSSSLAPDSSPLRSERRLNERIYEPNVSKSSSCNPLSPPVHQRNSPEDMMEIFSKFVDKHSVEIKELLASKGKL